MCNNPGTLPNGQKFACRKCSACRQVYVKDWVGRCIAESKTAVSWDVVTLTYGDENWYDARDVRKDQRAQAALLTYDDVQLFFKKLRAWRGPKVGRKREKCNFKYFCVGEYGSEKGRAHWHVIMFWSTKAKPEIDYKAERFFMSFWPHGHTHWRKGEGTCMEAAGYAAKYLQKELVDVGRQKALYMSKTPPLGTDYFALRAQKYVDAGLSPQNVKYGFPDVLRKDGSQREFMMTKTVARDFIAEFVRRWKLTHGSRWWPHSDVVEFYLDKVCEAPEFVPEPRRHPQEKPWFVMPTVLADDDPKFYFDEKLNAYYVTRMGVRFYWSFDEQGRRAWLDDVIRTEPLNVKPASQLRENGFNEYSARKSGSLYANKRKNIQSGKL